MKIQNGKKLGALLLALALAAGSFAGCSGRQGENASSGAASGGSSASPSSQADTGSTGSYNYSAGLTEDGYFEGVTALDYVTLPDYKTMTVPEDVSTVSDADVEDELDSMRDGYATTEQVKDRPVEDGDTVNIDYVGSVDGVEFEGGNTGGNGTIVTIGVTNYIDDFLDQLIGHMPGETFDVNVTFPEDYGKEDLNGKDAVFVTTINYIEDQTLPELTDEFVVSNWKESNGWSNVAEAKAGVKESLRAAAVADYLWEEIQEKSTVKEVPDALRSYHEEYMKQYYTSVASQYQMTVEDFISQQFGAESMEVLVEQNRSQLDSNARTSLIAQALSEDMDVRPTDDDVKDYFQKVMGSNDYSEAETFYGMPYLRMLTRENLVKEMLGR